MKLSLANDPQTTRARKRDQILDAALRAFARTGYHRARISDIAREAGIAYGLVYHYFKNKDEILDTLVAERWTVFLEAVDEIADGQGDTEDKLLQVAALIMNAYRVRPEWVKVLILEIQRSPRFAEPGRIRAVGRLFQTVARILRDGQEAGELRGDLDPDVACYVFIGGLENALTALVLGVVQIEESQAEGYYLKVARTVVDVVLCGLAKEGSRP